jgi:adenylosuccinate lyase
MSREEAYAVVQDNAMRAWQDGLEFKDLLLADERVGAVIGRKEIEEVFRLENFLENVDYIFERTFGGKRGHEERKSRG